MERFRSAFTKTELIKADSIDAKAGNIVKLGEYVVPAGELVALGYGTLTGQESAEGRIFVDLQDTTKAIEGTVRLTVYSPQDRPYEIVHEFRTETLRQNASDRTKQIPFPKDDLFVSEDKKIVMEFIPDADCTVDKAKSKIIMDITKQVF